MIAPYYFSIYVFQTLFKKIVQNSLLLLFSCGIFTNIYRPNV